MLGRVAPDRCPFHVQPRCPFTSHPSGHCTGSWRGPVGSPTCHLLVLPEPQALLPLLINLERGDEAAPAAAPWWLHCALMSSRRIAGCARRPSLFCCWRGGANCCPLCFLCGRERKDRQVCLSDRGLRLCSHSLQPAAASTGDAPAFLAWGGGVLCVLAGHPR